MWVILLILFSASCVFSDHHGNPANDLVDIVNKNRSAQQLPRLNDSPGLGCMALQYAEFCQANCDGENVAKCNPTEADFSEVFAPNCGVELPTLGTITGHLMGCRSKYLEPSLAFAQVLVKDNRTLFLLGNRTHREIGVGLVGFHHKGPSFWSVLFSDGQANSTFILEDRGKGLKQRIGCYSGSSFPCNNALIKAPVSCAGIFSLVASLIIV